MKPEYLANAAIITMLGIGEMFFFSGCKKDAELPELSTSAITDITINSAVSGGEITTDGGADVISRGLCWSISQEASVTGSHTTDGTGTGKFTSSISGVTPNTRYYVRAYATNSVGTAYGDELVFTTDPIVVATLTTNAVTSITTTSGVSGGVITDDGGGEITARGVCWGVTSGPTVSGSKTSDNTGTGSFMSNITGLSENTKYYVRAYATNIAGTVYGNEVSFTTSSVVAPVVTTSAVSMITSSSAISGGNVTSDGGGSISTRGICWAITENPTISNTKTTVGTGTGIFSSELSGLQPGTTYHIRAYATNSAATTYGNDVSFTTIAVVPVISTTNVTGISQTSAISGGTISSNGGAAITVKGICWGTTTDPTTEDAHSSNGAGSSSFTHTLSGLTPNTRYYVRAYATNSAGTAYGNEETFTTSPVTLAILTTTPESNVTLSEVTLGGNITSAGGGTILERGICWGTGSNPSVSGSHTHQGEGTGVFSANLSGLSAGSKYYARAYATNDAGTSYGQQVEFSTSVSDSEGRIYATVIIGTQIWMAENLKTTRYNGISMVNVTGNEDWKAQTGPAYCWYANSSANGNTYGNLYNWYAAAASGLCPTGWNVPTDGEFKTLEMFLGMTQEQADATLFRGTDEGTQLKSTTTWYPNNGSNSSGFNALGGGYRLGKSDSSGDFCDLGQVSYWWTSSEHWDGTHTKGLYRRLDSNNPMVHREGVDMPGGKYIRCLKD